MLTKSKAKTELKKILTQKTVSVSRLAKIMEVLDYEQLEKAYIQQGEKVSRQKEALKKLNEKRGAKYGHRTS